MVEDPFNMIVMMIIMIMLMMIMLMIMVIMIRILLLIIVTMIFYRERPSVKSSPSGGKGGTSPDYK